jgi:Uma2 family endonuclease
MADPAETQRYVSREDYIRWVESRPNGRSERIDGRIITMVPERGAHLRVKAAVWLALRQAIAAAGVNCQALPDGATVSS